MFMETKTHIFDMKSRHFQALIVATDGHDFGFQFSCFLLYFEGRILTCHAFFFTLPVFVFSPAFFLFTLVSLPSVFKSGFSGKFKFSHLFFSPVLLLLFTRSLWFLLFLLVLFSCIPVLVLASLPPFGYIDYG